MKLLLTKREWTVIFNILVNREYKIGDAMIVMSIVNQLKPLVAFETNITPESAEKQAPDARPAPIITKKAN